MADGRSWGEDPDDPLEGIARRIDKATTRDPDLQQELKDIAAQLRGVSAADRAAPKKPPPWIGRE